MVRAPTPGTGRSHPVRLATRLSHHRRHGDPEALRDGDGGAGLGVFQPGAEACVWFLARAARVDRWAAAGSSGPAPGALRGPFEVRVSPGAPQLCPQSPALSPRVCPLRRLVSVNSAPEADQGLRLVCCLSLEEESPLQWPAAPDLPTPPRLGRARLTD